MAEPKTQKTKVSVSAFIGAVEDDTRRKDAKVVDKMLREITGEKPAMWGPTIIGYGEYDGATGKWPRIGFSPRKANTVVYVLPGYTSTEMTERLGRLGKHKTGKSCLYLGKLADVNMDVLEEIVTDGVAHMRKTYKTWDV